MEHLKQHPHPQFSVRSLLCVGKKLTLSEKGSERVSPYTERTHYSTNSNSVALENTAELKPVLKRTSFQWWERTLSFLIQGADILIGQNIIISISSLKHWKWTFNEWWSLWKQTFNEWWSLWKQTLNGWWKFVETLEKDFEWMMKFAETLNGILNGWLVFWNTGNRFWMDDEVCWYRLWMDDEVC